MGPRIDMNKAAPAAVHAMLGLEHFNHQSGLEPKLVELVKMRASQINGCAYCLDMHSKDARAARPGHQQAR
jgi:AhpD family alkylhydroperoxidase